MMPVFTTIDTGRNLPEHPIQISRLQSRPLAFVRMCRRQPWRLQGWSVQRLWQVAMSCPHRKSHELTFVWIPDISANEKPHPKEWPFWGEVYITKLGWQPSLQTVLPCNYSNIGPFLRQRIIVPLSGQRQEQMFLNLLYCYWHSLLYGRLPSEYYSHLLFFPEESLGKEGCWNDRLWDSIFSNNFFRLADRCHYTVV